MAKISVVVPAYNCENFIAETLESLLNQTLKDIEVIIINDGSTDNTQAVIDSFTKKSEIFKCYIQENAGVFAARNNGLEKAAGEYVVFLDADDFFTPTSLEAFYKKATETNADVVMGRLRNYTDGKAQAYHEYADKLALCDNIDMFDKRLLWSFLVGNKCYKRTKLLESGVRFPSFGFSEEGAFFMSVVYCGVTMCGTMDSCMYYRRHTRGQGLSVSQTASVKNINSLNGSMNEILTRALTALENAADPIDKDDYIQEIYFKHAHILVSQFYREMWKCDEECQALCAKTLDEIKKKLTKKRFAALCAMNPDLNIEKLISSKSEIKENPVYSIIIDGFYDGDFFDSIYDQTSPLFELIVTEETMPLLGERFEKKENIKVAKNIKQARKIALSDKKIVFKKPCKLNSRSFQTVYRFNFLKKLLNITFSLLLRVLNLLLIRRDGK